MLLLILAEEGVALLPVLIVVVVWLDGALCPDTDPVSLSPVWLTPLFIRGGRAGDGGVKRNTGDGAKSE